VSPLPASMNFKLSLKPTRGEHGEYQVNGAVSGTASGGGDDGASSEGPWQIHIEPVAAVHMAHPGEGKRPKISIRGGELKYADGHVTIRLDAETGRIIDLRCSAGTWIKHEFLVGRLEQGAFDKTASMLRAKGQAYRNCYEEQHKIGSAWNFTITQIEKQPVVQSAPELMIYCRVARQVQSSQTLAVLWSRWVELMGEDASTFGLAKKDLSREFRIPAEFSSKQDDMAAAVDTGLLAVPAMADLMFPRGSWPWTISREACFWELKEQLYAGQADQAAALAANEFRRMAAGQVGPLGALALAQSMKQLESPDAAQASAIGNWGISMLSQEAFANDVSLVTEGDSGLALVCRAGAETLCRMSPEEQDQLIGLLPAELQEPATRIAKRHREQPNEPIGATIQAALVESWNDGLRDVVQAELREVSTEVAKKPGAAESVK